MHRDTKPADGGLIGAAMPHWTCGGLRRSCTVAGSVQSTVDQEPAPIHPLASTLGQENRVSRAFVREDGAEPRRREFVLPPRDDPEFDAAAAEALLEGASVGETAAAEQATGYYWGEPRLRDHVRRILERARHAGDDRLEQVAERYLR